MGVEWTPKAEQMIVDGEYLYISPVFEYNPESGEIIRMRMAAITNAPAVDGMANLASLTSEELTNLFDQNDSEEEYPMKALLVLLGLPENATEEQATAALTELYNTPANSDNKPKTSYSKLVNIHKKVGVKI